ncbi:MAG: hypothetical protein H6704_20210 [Myxococcales bacterium]|nr:hypothetical protein [Myxococcales bacterium]
MGGTPAGPDVSTVALLEAYLDGKMLLMAGDDIPTDPNGFNENVNFGQATQCYHRIEMTVQGGAFNLTTTTGVLENAPENGDVGMCDRDTAGVELMFQTTSYVIENLEGNAECFDITLTFMGFGQEGRGAVSPDGSELWLEVFFKDQAVGHRCADGGVGDQTVTLNGMPFTGDAVQVFQIGE